MPPEDRLHESERFRTFVCTKVAEAVLPCLVQTQGPTILLFVPHNVRGNRNVYGPHIISCGGYMSVWVLSGREMDRWMDGTVIMSSVFLVLLRTLVTVSE